MLQSNSLYLNGIGHFHPDNIIDNQFLEDLDIDTNNEWILERVGIHSRRTVLPLEYIAETKNKFPLENRNKVSHTNAETGALAAQKAMDRASINAQQIGMVIAGGCSPENTIPSEACSIAAKLNITAPAFDVNSACSSFAAQLHFLNAFKTENLPDYILVVNVENTTRTIDFSDRNSAVLWGDASSAAILSPRKKGKFKIQTTFFEADPSGWDKVMIPTGGHFYQNGKAVQNFAIKKSISGFNHLADGNFSDSSQPYFIGHQANLLMLEGVCRRAGIPTEKHLFNVDTFGNCGAAGAPSVLSQNWEQFKSKDSIALVVVGSGLAWGGVLLEKT